MSEKKRILEAIRMRMRRDGITYAKLAKSLSVSEVSVKRYFSEERLSLDLLDDICRSLGAPLDVLLAELKSLAYEQRDTFSDEQEAALADDDFLFVLFFLVARGRSFDEIDRHFEKKQTAKIVRALRELEALQLISYPSNSALRSLVTSNAQIRPGGALWKKYSYVGIQEFFNCHFSADNEYFKLSLGYISDENAKQLKKKFELLEDEIKTMLAVEQVTTRNGKKKKFYWVAQCFRPMDSTVLEVIAEKSRLC